MKKNTQTHYLALCRLLYFPSVWESLVWRTNKQTNKTSQMKNKDAGFVTHIEGFLNIFEGSQNVNDWYEWLCLICWLLRLCQSGLDQDSFLSASPFLARSFCHIVKCLMLSSIQNVYYNSFSLNLIGPRYIETNCSIGTPENWYLNTLSLNLTLQDSIVADF